MRSKKVTFALSGMYLFSWGIQYLINNFMPVYVASLPFSTDKTVGEVLAIGAIVTCISEAVWSYIAGKAKNKANVFFVSLIMLIAVSLLFLYDGMTKPFLYICVVLLYGVYMVHQPLTDTICSETHQQTKFGFGFFRSFGSLGYALTGFVLVFLPNKNPTSIFVYTAVVAAITAVFSKMMRAPRVYNAPEEKNKNIFNSAYIRFLIYAFVLGTGCSSISAFFAVYFTSPEGLGGSIEMFSMIMGLSAFVEWLIVMFYSKISKKISAKYTFFIIAVAGVFRSLVIYLAPVPAVAAFSVVFNCIWYGLLWANLAPYIKSIVPAEGNAFAQGIWAVVSHGVGAFVGSYLSGIYADAFGQRNLFLAIAIMMGVLALFTPALIEDK